MDEISPREAAIRFARMGEMLNLSAYEGLKRASQIVKTEARNMLGTYQSGWPELAAITKDERERQGYPADEPLKRSGILKNSILKETDKELLTSIVGVPNKMVKHPYSNEEVNIGEVAEAHERGTDHIPPRPFLGTAAHKKSDAIVALVGENVYTNLMSVASGQTTYSVALKRSAEDSDIQESNESSEGSE